MGLLLSQLVGLVVVFLLLVIIAVLVLLEVEAGCCLFEPLLVFFDKGFNLALCVELVSAGDHRSFGMHQPTFFLLGHRVLNVPEGLLVYLFLMLEDLLLLFFLHLFLLGSLHCVRVHQHSPHF